MEEPPIEMPFLRNVGLFVTYRCQVTCPHCIVRAGPNRREEISSNESVNWIQQIVDYRDGFIKVLSLTGGEPFIDLGKLQAISAIAAAKGLFVSAVTNAFWASSKETAMGTLEAVPSIGMIAISTDKYHLASIPFERVENAIYAARKKNLPFNVSVCTQDESDPDYLSVLKQLRAIASEEEIRTAVTFPAGRAVENLSAKNYTLTSEVPVSACGAGSSPIIFPDGRVIACIGPVIDLPEWHPLVLGKLRNESLNEILDRAESNPVLHAIRIWGPKKLISHALEAGMGMHLPTEYVKDSACFACMSLMSNQFLVRFLKDLAVREEFTRRVAFGRKYYLGEEQMLELGVGVGQALSSVQN